MKAAPATSSLMNAVASLSSLLAACCFLVGLSLLAGCSAPRGSGVVGNSTPQLAHALSASEPAQLAARLANEECERRFHRHPFQADQHPAILQDGEYRWGGLDVGAPKGYSALVRIREDGSKPSVEVTLAQIIVHLR